MEREHTRVYDVTLPCCIVDCHALDFYSRTCDWNSINVPFPISHLSAAPQKSYYHSPIYSVISLRYHCSCTRGDGSFQVAKNMLKSIEYDKIRPGCEFLDKNTKRTRKKIAWGLVSCQSPRSHSWKALGIHFIGNCLGSNFSNLLSQVLVRSTTSPSSTEDSAPQLDWMYSPKEYSLVPDR